MCWPIDRIRRRRAALRRDPLVLIENTGTRQRVVEACRQALSQGVRPGMTLPQARAMCPSLVHAEHEPGEDDRALIGLGRWLMRFTPVVSLAPPDTVFLDVGGCERLYGGLDVLMHRVADALAKLRITARLAIAPTPGAAWAIASFDPQPQKIVAENELPAALAPLPTAALRLDSAAVTLLSQLGIETIGQLMALPREDLPARFGAAILECIDLAMGRLFEPLVPLAPHTPIEAGIEFDGPVESIEAIWHVLRSLIGQLMTQLIRRGCGARQMRVAFHRANAPPIEKLIRLSRPSRDPVNLFNLLRCAFETVESDEGFIAIRLAVPVFERLSDEQIRLLDQHQQAADNELAHLVERLVARMGTGAIAQPRLVDSHLPERAFQWIEPQLDTPSRPARVMRCDVPPAVVPLRLLPVPVEVSVVVSPSHDEDGPPLLFTHKREVHRIAQSDGPQRIGGMWWEGRGKTRDYFDVQDESGRRYWLFRVVQTGKWYLHGLFE